MATIDIGDGSGAYVGTSADDVFIPSAVVSSSAQRPHGHIDGGSGNDTIDLRGVRPASLGLTQDSTGAYVPDVTLGSEVIELRSIEKILFGDDDNTFVDITSGLSGVTVDTGGGADHIIVETSATALAGAGNDSIFISGSYGSPLTGSIDGGAGIDTLQLNIGFIVDLVAGTASAGIAHYSLTAIENVQATTFGYSTSVYGDDNANALTVSSISDDGTVGVTFDGRGGADTIVGSHGADTLMGGAGNDFLTGGAGNDVIDGGIGNDIASYSANRAAATVTINESGHLITISDSLNGTDTLQHVEQFLFSDGLFSFDFAPSGAPVLSNFNSSNGWSSQEDDPRHVADVNGDGYADLVGFGTNGALVSYGSASGSFSAPAVVISDFGQAQGWNDDNIYHRVLVDVDSDSKADIIGFGISGVYASLATSVGFANPVLELQNFNSANGWSSQDAFARGVADVNGDGKADIVGFGIAGTYVALGIGDGNFQAPMLAVQNFGSNQGWTSDNIYHRELADVNGDGKADIVGFGTSGVYVALGQADGTFGSAALGLENFNSANGWLTQDSFTRTAVDINGDGKADIVGFGQNGVFVAYSNGDGSFNSPSFDVADFGQSLGWSSDNHYHREMADLNHDGLNDIVGFGVGGVLTAMNHSEFTV